MAYEHLSDKACAALEMDDDNRVRKMRSPNWIGYPRARRIMDILEDNLTCPKHHRMPNLLIAGRSDNGKSMIARRFDALHPCFDNPDGCGITMPVLMVQAPPVPEESRFYGNILDTLFAPYKPKETAARKQSQVVELLRRLNVGMLIIDDINNIVAGHVEKQRQLLNVIKFLSNELMIPITATGTKDALRALQAEPQMASRFDVEPLPNWEMGDEYLRLMVSFERILPLKNPSDLAEQTLAAKVLSMSDGTIGSLSKILVKASAHAVRCGAERIDRKVLEAINWIPPMEKRRNADRIL